MDCFGVEDCGEFVGQFCVAFAGDCDLIIFQGLSLDEAGVDVGVFVGTGGGGGLFTVFEGGSGDHQFLFIFDEFADEFVEFFDFVLFLGEFQSEVLVFGCDEEMVTLKLLELGGDCSQSFQFVLLIECCWVFRGDFEG